MSVCFRACMRACMLYPCNINECFVAQEWLSNAKKDNSPDRTKKDADTATPWLFEYYPDNQTPVMGSGDIRGLLRKKDTQVCAQNLELPDFARNVGVAAARHR